MSRISRYVLLAVVTSFGVAHSALASNMTYLALGDSLAFGTGADQTSADVSNGDRGYVGLVADALASQNGGVRPNVINLGVFGATSTSFLNGGGGIDTPAATLQNTNYASPAPTQDSLMLSTIASELQAGHGISTVSLQLGANDLFQLALSPAFQSASPQDQMTMITQTFTTFQTNELTIIGQIKAQLPQANLILVGYYDPYAPFVNASTSNPLYPFAQFSHATIQNLNALLAADAAGANAIFVNPYTAFQGNEFAFTNIASPDGNVHPTADGYATIANLIIEAAVPEPTSLMMLGTGVLGVFGYARRRRSA